MIKIKLDATEITQLAKDLKTTDLAKIAMDVMGDNVIFAMKLYRKTVATWIHKVYFTFQAKKSRGKSWILTIDTSDDAYKKLDYGFTPKPGARIYARPGHVLAFHSRYKCKSKPNVISSFPGGPVMNSPMVFAKSVKQGKIEPRNWSKIIREKFIEKMDTEFRPKVLDIWLDQVVPQIKKHFKRNQK